MNLPIVTQLPYLVTGSYCLPCRALASQAPFTDSLRGAADRDIRSADAARQAGTPRGYGNVTMAAREPLEESRLDPYSLGVCSPQVSTTFSSSNRNQGIHYSDSFRDGAHVRSSRKEASLGDIWPECKSPMPLGPIGLGRSGARHGTDPALSADRGALRGPHDRDGRQAFKAAMGDEDPQSGGSGASGTPGRGSLRRRAPPPKGSPWVGGPERRVPTPRRAACQAMLVPNGRALIVAKREPGDLREWVPPRRDSRGGCTCGTKPEASPGKPATILPSRGSVMRFLIYIKVLNPLGADRHTVLRRWPAR